MERVDYQSLIIQELIGFASDRSLNLSPWYQRRSVWSTPQKAYLINSILERKPVPTVYIRHQIDLDEERSIKEVVDGQQRIRTILAYRQDEFAAKHPAHARKVKFSELTRTEKETFVSTALSVGYLIGADDRDVIEIFGRINSISKTLNPQEKRNSQYSGDFKQFCLRQAAMLVPFWRSTAIFSANDISRMTEVQFVSDLAINILDGLTDFSAAKIDKFYKDFDENFPRLEELEDRFARLFQLLAEIPPTAFSDTIFRQYQNAFSLMVVVDRLRDRRLQPRQIAESMLSIDERIRAYEDGQIDAEAVRFSEGFTGANLHRIRARRVRDEFIAAALA